MSGKAIIFSAPSGSGKTTIVKYLLGANPELEFSISATTRPKRGSTEVDGKDYYFLSESDFKTRIKGNEFIEWEEVYGGNFYGTLKSEVERLWNEGKNVIFDVDVEGGVNLKRYFGNKALSVFVKAPNIETIRKRLENRGTETEESLKRRMAKVEDEMKFQNQFDKILINDDLEASKADAQKLYDDLKKS